MLMISHSLRSLDTFGGLGACLSGIAILILLHVDDILLISYSLEGLKRH